MRFRSLTLIAAIALLSACAAEDPMLESSAPEASDPTVQATPETTTAPVVRDDSADDTEVHEAEHEDIEEDNEHGDEGATPTDATGARVIEVTMTDFAFEPSTIEVDGGETVMFVAKNEGAIEHELRLSNAHRIEEHIASGHADHDDEGGGHHAEDADIILLVEPGATGELIFEVPEDATLYTHAACLLPGHYEAGMVADLTVTG